MDIEKQVLGSMMLDANTVIDVCDVITHGVFYSSRHQKIFKAITDVDRQNKPVDLLTVREALKRMNQLEAAGGSLYLTECVESVISAVNAGSHAKILLEKSLLRKTIQVCDKIVGECYDPRDEVVNIINGAEQAILDISDKKTVKRVREPADIMQEALSTLRQYRDDPERAGGIKTGYRGLDNIIFGLEPGEYIIIAGRTSTGKTAFAVNIAENVGINQGKGVTIFSFEMADVQLAIRILCSRADIGLNKVRYGELREGDWERLKASSEHLSGMPIYIDESCADIFDIESRLRRYVRDKDVKLGIIDYAGLVGCPRMSSRREEISFISKRVKRMARALGIPIILLVQLSRGIEGRQNKEPRLSDLKESGDLEQDADKVLFIHLDENPESEECKIIVGKHRTGPTGDYALIFKKDVTRFESPSFKHEISKPEPKPAPPPEPKVVQKSMFEDEDLPF